MDRLARLFVVPAVVLIAATMMADLAGARDDLPSGSAPAAVYDIAPQPLDSALDAYIRASGSQVFYETALTANRRSAAVKGRLTPAAALEALLAGSGLAARRTDVDAFVITLAPRPAGTSAATVAPDRNWLGILQKGVLAALCRNPQTRPGGYRIAIELWIAPDGIIQRSALVGTTGDAMRDAALTATLQGTAIGAPPPAGAPQPFIIAIAPRPPRETGDCGGR